MIAIKRNNGDLVWLDAVLSFQESYSSSVTKHQIESGTNISDHVIEDNAKFALNGVVSGIEFNGGNVFLNVPQESLDAIGATSQINASIQSGPVSIGSSFSNPLIKLLPDSVRQFIGNDSPPSVTMGQSFTPDNIKDIKEILINMNKGFPRYDDKTKKSVLDKELLTLVEFDIDYSIIQLIDSCVCTGVNFQQDPESGDAIYPQMSFERVRFVPVVTTTLPQNVADAVKNSASSKSQKGKQQPKGSGSTSSTVPVPPGILDPKTNPTSNTDQSKLKEYGGDLKAALDDTGGF